MPEGDSYRRIAERLQPLVGERVSATSPNPRGAATGVARAVDQRLLDAVVAQGKELRLAFDGGVVLVSRLRMSGRWRVLPPDARVSGAPWLVLRTDVATAIQLHGPLLFIERTSRPRRALDLLDGEVGFEAMVGRLRLADPRRPLGEVLQDQSLVAGIGNMWAAEMLWAAELHPLLEVGAAEDAELEQALEWGRAAMLESVAHHRPARAVYRQAGRPCPRCGAPIVHSRVGDLGRTMYRCDRCQRGQGSGSRSRTQ